MITVTGFTDVAQQAAEGAGLDSLRVAHYPGAVGVHHDEIQKNIKENLFDQIVDGLTKPLADPASTGKETAVDSTDIVCEGTLEEVNRFFIDKEWVSTPKITGWVRTS